ncbi:putative 2-nitropropane dioxygenase precursor [Tripterygium wilfordii]|uniref:Putative 2-nitropropane dioxygenase n=1 Tax=Tripterygium wilfordii TaxID=458696 RepID=A0A7J7CH41_TRIWF|nr:putative 2-nitropropane dioxygenase precursor [Tripterygium wilfordii]
MGWKEILGFEYGIIQAPLRPDISGPEFVAAVANAGVLGFLRAPDWPFVSGVILAFPHEENLRAILDENVAALQVYWRKCSKELVLEAHRVGIKVVLQVESVEEAREAINDGVDAIIVQGREAG